MNAPANLPGEPPRARHASLAERLAREVDRFDPFEALRLLEGGGPVRGALTNRFVATPLRPGAGRDGAGAAVEAAFVGLVGPLGPLPPFYTETALRERKRRSHALRAFLDLFLGRLVALFLRAFEKYRMPAAVARHGTQGSAPVTEALHALIGLGLPALRGRMLTSDAQLLPYAGLLAREVRSAAGLEVLLADHFGLPVRVQPLRRRWLAILPDEQTRLGAPGGSSAAPTFSRLSRDAVAGSRTPDVSSTFRVVLDPVDYGTFQWFAPGGPAMARLVELTRFYMDCGLDFEVQVVLRKEDVPEAQLGAVGPRLGWNGWLRQLTPLRDADQAVFDPSSSDNASVSLGTR